MPEVQRLCRTTAFGYQDHNLVTACQRLTDHLPVNRRAGVRERMWKIRARHVVLATGAHERPLVFGNNDLPGIMLASAVSTYVNRYAAMPGRRAAPRSARPARSEEHTSELQSLMRISSAVFCLKKKNN